ncbi:MAG TPA: ImmA/IrrE family metallo-endopeptidase [Gemmatimonadales bacterium]|nr:ImmA/IrrE family metallo-endopeptidase [Gemmatimonadales bacterium]
MTSSVKMPLVTDTTAWVARKIKDAREEAGLSQAQLARRLGRTQTAISYWEAGKRAPGLDDLVELSGVLQRDIAYFLPGREETTPIRAILRATAERLDHQDLDRALQHLVDQAEALPQPAATVEISATQPARAARELLEHHPGPMPPVDVEELAHLCGLHVITAQFDDALSGVLVALEDGAVIGVNARHSPRRQRFSISHELGHFVLDHHDRFHIDLGPDTAYGTPPGYDWRSERAANDFAAELLMPTRIVEEAFTELPSPSALAERFDVSELAMSYRLQNLGLR